MRAVGFTGIETTAPGAPDTLPPEAERWPEEQVKREALNTRAA